MGKSKSIKEQLEKDAEFQKLIEELSKNMAERQVRLEQELDKMQEEHYKNFPDNALLIEGEYSHLTTLSEWSLKSISAIIDSCSKAIFGEESDTPEGSQKKETGEDVSASVKAIKSREQFIANAAFDVVQSIVGSFNDTTATSIEKKVDGKPIAPGMTLFIGVENNSFSSSLLFSNDKIVQTIFKFKVYYSIKEGQAQSALSDFEVYENQKEEYREKIDELVKLVEELDPSADDYEEKLTKYNNRAELMNERMKELTKKIAELSSNKLQAERDACNQIVDTMRSRKKCLSEGAMLTAKRITSRGFNYAGSENDIRDRLLGTIPTYVKIASIKHTDYVGNHYKVTLTSDTEDLTKVKVEGWIRDALTRDNKHPEFQFDLK